MSSKRWSAVGLAALATGMIIAPTMVSAATAGHGASAQPSGSTKALGVVTHTVSPAQQRATIAYWTPERMRNAKNLDLVVEKGSPPPAGQAAPQVRGTAGSVAPTAPGGRQLSGSLNDSQQGFTPQGFSYPFPFDRHAVYPLSLYTKSPWRVNGKLFFTQNGGNYVCSGTAVTSTNADEVWTAGHCVNDGAGNWDSFAEFVPAYNGTASNCCPEGIFVASRYATSSGWNSSHDFSLDLGAMIVGQNSKGVKLQNQVGAAGFAWNQSRDQQYVDFGYPAASPFAGNHMISCLGSTAVYDTGIGGSGAAPNGIGCDMTGGSSGGSWQISWGGANGSVPGYINGHNDYKYSSQPLAMYSPYFDNTANAVRCVLEVSGQNGC